MKVLAIGAHPDDIEYGCGGTLLKMRSSSRYDVQLEVMALGTLSEERGDEQDDASLFLGIDYYAGGQADTAVDERRTRDFLWGHFELFQPDIVFCPYWDDSHQDHRAVAQAVIPLARYIPKVFFYSTFSTLNFMPKIFVNIEDFFTKKIELLRCFKSQIVPYRDIIFHAGAMAGYHGGLAKCKYAEGFDTFRFTWEP